MTFYQELQLNQAGSKNLLKKSETVKEKSYHILRIFGKDSCYNGILFFHLLLFSVSYLEMRIVLWV